MNYIICQHDLTENRKAILYGQQTEGPMIETFREHPQKSHPRDMRLLRHLISVMNTCDLTKTFREQPQRVILEN